MLGTSHRYRTEWSCRQGNGYDVEYKLISRIRGIGIGYLTAKRRVKAETYSKQGYHPVSWSSSTGKLIRLVLSEGISSSLPIQGSNLTCLLALDVDVKQIMHFRKSVQI